MGTIDESKLAIHATLGEMADVVCKRLENKIEKPISTEEIAKALGVGESTVTYYHGLGMPKNAYNSWYESQCIEWRDKVYPKIIQKPGRKPKK